MNTDLKIERLKGNAILPYISDLARLRIEIFKSYPYLYSGDLDYEKNYLQNYASCSETVIVLVTDKNKVVGVSTAIPLEFEGAESQKPFIENGIAVTDVFYFGESVLQAAYRGRNIYRSFFQERETAAKEYGSKIAAFCGVQRQPEDPRKPEDYIPLDATWKHFGYTKHSNMIAYYGWTDIGEEKSSDKPMVFWIKNL